MIAENPLLPPDKINWEASHERTANARVISAAPELLEALKWLNIAIAEWKQAGQPWEAVQEAQAAADAAIAKATK